MSSLKKEFDSGFESLLDKLNSLTGDVLMKALGDNPQKKDHDRLNGYWMALQLEILDKIRNLTSFQNNLNLRCHKILMKIDYIDLSDTNTSQGPSDDIPQARNSRLAPNTVYFTRETETLV